MPILWKIYVYYKHMKCLSSNTLANEKKIKHIVVVFVIAAAAVDGGGGAVWWCCCCCCRRRRRRYSCCKTVCIDFMLSDNPEIFFSKLNDLSQSIQSKNSQIVETHHLCWVCGISIRTAMVINYVNSLTLLKRISNVLTL